MRCWGRRASRVAVGLSGGQTAATQGTCPGALCFLGTPSFIPTFLMAGSHKQRPAPYAGVPGQTRQPVISPSGLTFAMGSWDGSGVPGAPDWAHSAGSFVLCSSPAAAGQKVLFEGDSSSHAGLCPSPLPPWWDLGLALPCPTLPVGSQSPCPSDLGPVVRADAPQATALFALLGYMGQPGVGHLPDHLSFLLKAAQLLLDHLSTFIFA